MPSAPSPRSPRPPAAAITGTPINPRKGPTNPAKESLLQRLFSAFPGGSPGVGLFLLRTAVGAAAVVEGTLALTGPGDATVATWTMGLVAIVTGALLMIGFLTPCAGALVVVGSVAIAQPWFPALAMAASPDRLAAGFVAVVSAAIVPLGPGAFSLDAHLFGRREIVIPQDPRTPKD